MSQLEEDEALYRFASIARLDEDDPASPHVNEGDIIISEGRCVDGVCYTVFQDDDFYDVSCTVLGLLRADTEMSQTDITRWAARTANQMDIMERLNR